MVLLELGQLLLLFGIYLGRVFYLSSLEGVFCPQLFHKRFQLGAVLLQNQNVLFEVRNSCLGLLEAGVLFSQLALLGVLELLLQFSDRAFELFSLQLAIGGFVLAGLQQTLEFFQLCFSGVQVGKGFFGYTQLFFSGGLRELEFCLNRVQFLFFRSQLDAACFQPCARELTSAQIVFEKGLDFSGLFFRRRGPFSVDVSRFASFICSNAESVWLLLFVSISNLVLWNSSSLAWCSASQRFRLSLRSSTSLQS
ncbi:Hypothetical_protein [Hexamita inflata]|uniref:Hypothetical_protein n=1 Tax=Hexamita inflata TaxID=28002 RepID=A0AA86U6X9_9EUKA|nr:Hypothetical protein HINF_LOCUS27782 [Hexamita inflata]